MNKASLHESNCPICASARLTLWGTAADIGDRSILHNVAKCRACTHIFIDNIPSADILNEAYRTDNPSVTTGGKDFFEWRSTGNLSEVDKWVLSHATGIEIKGNLLDIGSANMNLLNKIKNLGWKVTVIEPGKHANQLRELLQCRVYGCVFEQCALDETYEIISAIDVLEHVSSPIEFLTKVKSVLSADGIALLRFPNSKSLQCILNKDKWQMIRPIGHLHFFSPMSFQTACRLSGLKIVSIATRDLSKYSPLSLRGRRIPIIKVVSPLKTLLDARLLGDQLLVKVRHA